MEVRQASLAAVAATIGQLPQETLPEIVFAGKSNVGKSSLINILVNRKSLARTSSEPGKTRTINFYQVDQSWMFVDLPGYGYARTGHAEQERFSRVIDYYLQKRQNIRYIFLLVDCRHEPSANDKAMLDWMRFYHYRPVIIATKSDKLSRNQLNKSLSLIRKGLELEEKDIMIPFSALNKSGRDEIWQLIETSGSTDGL
ncbi:MAG: YihA family ribosome biogenesis GTP-binding protein [Firmicutes bacterium]|nr:YihA family ribosome biogenesis GTP-binding protein [Bacillota bacterium]